MCTELNLDRLYPWIRCGCLGTFVDNVTKVCNAKHWEFPIIDPLVNRNIASLPAHNQNHVALTGRNQ